MPQVERKPEENLESLLKRFRRKMQESGQLRAYQRKRYFVSKGEARRDKERKAERRLRRRESQGRGRGFQQY